MTEAGERNEPAPVFETLDSAVEWVRRRNPDQSTAMTNQIAVDLMSKQRRGMEDESYE